MLKGNDHYHAMDVEDLKNFTKIIGEISLLRGITKVKKAIESEKISRINARRSIVTKTKLPKNHVLVADDLTYKRPGTLYFSAHKSVFQSYRNENQLQFRGRSYFCNGPTLTK